MADIIYPGATWRPLPENASQPTIVPTQIILHTAVDGPNTTSLYGWFDTGTTLESHFYAQKAGTGEQYISVNRRADANYKANQRAVSIEAWDGMATYGTYQMYNKAQVEWLVGCIDWLCRTLNIPRRLCDTWDSPGIGWHNMFPEWSPTATGCPGEPRKTQITNIILPRVQKQAFTPTDTDTDPEEDDDMKSIVGFDPRQDQWYHLFANIAVQITGKEAGFLKALGVVDVGALPPEWIDSCKVFKGGLNNLS